MIPVPPGVRVLIATRPVDFRKGADSLAALAKETLGQDPFSGAVLVFRSRRADRVKILVWDGSGVVLVWKRLEQGAFKWPPIIDGVMRLSPAQLAALVEGLDSHGVLKVKRIGSSFLRVSDPKSEPFVIRARLPVHRIKLTYGRRSITVVPTSRLRRA